MAVRIVCLIAVLVLMASAGCGDDANGPNPDTGPADAAVGEASVQPDGSGDAAEPKPDGPTEPARWETVTGTAPAVEEHTATLLDDGKVLVAGGVVQALKPTYSASVSIYDPSTNAFSAAKPLAEGRANHTATLLNDGKVLVVGGNKLAGSLTSVEIFDPGTGSWSLGPSLVGGRTRHVAVRLQTGDVMVAAGYGEGLGTHLDDMAIYQASAGTWSFPAKKLNEGRTNASGTLLDNGKVLIAGGYNNDAWLDTMELYDPSAGTITSLPAMKSKRCAHSATLLLDKKVLFVGGWYTDNYLTKEADDELYDPLTNTTSGLAHPGEPVRDHAAVLLEDGRVVIIGGKKDSQQTSVVIYDPSAGGSWSTGPPMTHGRFGHTATLLQDGSVLVVGGKTGAGASNYVSTAERFYP